MKILKIYSLDKGWCDKDHILLHAAFQLLIDFVEKERSARIVDWNSDFKQNHAWQKMKAPRELP